MLSRWLTPLLVAIIGISVSLLVAYEADRAQKNLRTSELSANLERWLSVLEFSTEKELTHAKTLATAFEDLSVLDESAFALLSANALKLYPDLDAVFWVPAIEAQQLSVFEKQMQLGSPEFMIKTYAGEKHFTPAPVADNYFPVTYLAGSELAGSEASLPYHGWDLGSFAAVGSAFQHLDTQDKKFEVRFVPALDTLVDEQAPQSRWQMLLLTKLAVDVLLPNGSRHVGASYLVFVVDFSLMFDFFSDLPGGDTLQISVTVEVGRSDDAAKTAAQTVFEVQPQVGELEPEYTAFGSFSDRATAVWQVKIVPTDAFFSAQSNRIKLWVITIGLIITVLLMWYLYAIKRRTAMTEKIVDLRTQELQLANHELDRLSHTDYLTGVANRRYFEENLEHEWARALRGKYPVTLLMVDVDSFKLYNDHYGHIQGDECLKSIAKALMDTVKRPADIVARYGGEEFVLMLPNTDQAVASLAEACRRNVEELQLPHKDSAVSVYVTISVGVATMQPTPGQSYRLLIKAADDALYQAKEQGRNQVVVVGLPEQ